MHPVASINLDSLLEIVNRKLLENYHRPFNSTEIIILQGIWQYQTYSRIAQEAGYSPGYFTNVVAPELCKRLSELLGQRVTKKNCRALLEAYVAAQTASETMLPPDSNRNLAPRYPSGAVPLDSPFYIKRSSIKTQVDEEVCKPGALVRIKAPREMGKTSLLLRILDYANRQGCRTVSLSLEQIDQAILSDLNRFLRWLCANVTRQLQLEPRLDSYWDDDIGSKVSCTLYFRSYLLEQTDVPLVLAIDEVSQVFEHPQVAKDFLPLLRSWYEEAKRLPVWQKLRLIVVHSTDIYVPLQLSQSPFNVGLPIKLNSFTLDQVQLLAQRYGLDWSDGEAAKQLMDLVEGHPALIHIALYHLAQGMALGELLKTAPTASGIYGHHLQRHWVTLQRQPELAKALHQVMNAEHPVQLELVHAYKLSSMGLIEQLGDRAIPGCELYRQFFKN